MAEGLLRSFTLDNGALLAVERMPGTRSCAASWMLPVGTSGDPEGDAGEGESTVLAELVLRGAGGLSSRELSDAFDAIGAQRSGSAAVHHLVLSCLSMGERASEALRLMSLVVRRPGLEPESLEAVRAIALQALDGLGDEAQYLATVRLREHALPTPFNRTGYGTEAGLRALTPGGIRKAWARRCTPGGTIIGIAGDIDPERARDEVSRLLEGWSGETVRATEKVPARRGSHLVRMDTQQTHLAMGFDAPAEGDPDAPAFRVAVRVLGGATSSRLFTEVRERRGLCYSVGATSALGRDRGLMQVYAGSTHERAPRTLECILAELERFERGIGEDEFADALVGAKAALVMSGESSSARAATIASQLWTLGRPMDLAEAAAEYDRLTRDRVNGCIARVMDAEWRSRRTQVTVAPGETKSAG